MDWQYVAQWALAGLFAFGFLASVYSDFEPRQAKPAAGFGGFIGSCVSTALVVGLCYAAGAFSLLGK